MHLKRTAKKLGQALQEMLLFLLTFRALLYPAP